MQKIDFIENLESLVEKLKSNEILHQFDLSFRAPGQGYKFGNLTPLLFVSKSNYDQIKEDDRYKEILSTLGAEALFQEANLSRLTGIFVHTTASNILTNPDAVSLFNFHNTLQQTYELSKSVLQGPVLANSIAEEINNGVIVFQILIEGEGLETERYIKIFTAINELIETLSKIESEEEQKSEIILLDSGSDTNIGVKSGIETVKSLFLIFKEVWDFITNFRFYKEKQRQQALLDSLTIRATIKEKVDAGVLTEAEGLEYMHRIKTRTDDLIGMKVMPKQIVIGSNNFENKKLLQEFEGMKMLTAGNQADEL